MNFFFSKKKQHTQNFFNKFFNLFLNLFFSLLFINLVFTQNAFSQVILSGRVIDKSNQPLAFATIVQENTVKGTTTNAEGYYTLNLPAGNYNISYQYIGCKSKTLPVSLNTNQTLNVTLDPDDNEMAEIVITGANPAHEIIKKAQEKRKYYLEEEVKGYRSKIYTKIFEEADENGGTINLFGARKDIKKGIFYLSETMSELSFKQPNDFQERVLASKVSGDSAGYSYNRANWINFYRNTGFTANSISFVSPIAQNAFDYYEYKIEGNEKENGFNIYKIRISPKYKNAPAFKGYIYIVEETSRIHSVNAWVQKGTVSAFDSISIRQVYKPVTQDNKGAWLSQSLTFYFKLNINGVKGFYHTVSSDYELNPTFKNEDFGGKIFDFAENANKKDNNTWEEMRPIPLTESEKTDYSFKNTLETNTAKPEIKDSVVKAQNKNNVLDVLFTTGFRFNNPFNKTSYRVSALAQSINFNTVEGWVIDPSFSFTKIFAGNRRFFISPTVRYGFSNQRFQAKLETEYTFNPKKFGKISFEGGQYVSQYSSNFDEIPPVFNTLYTLFWKENWLKMYEKAYGKLRFEYEIFNGFNVGLTGEYAGRSPMENNNITTTAIDDKTREFTPNLATNLAILERPYMFDKHTAFIADAVISFTPGQKYLLRPDEKILQGSNKPTFIARYTKGFADTDFDMLRLLVRDTWNWGIFGNGSVTLEAGQFLNDNKVYFADFKHFRGNRILALQNGINSFQLLDYYAVSNTKNYFQAHWNHDFRGFLTDKVPFLKSAQTSLVMGANYLYTDLTGNYVETGIGINRLFRFLRVDWWCSFNEQGFLNQSMKVGFAF